MYRHWAFARKTGNRSSGADQTPVWMYFSLLFECLYVYGICPVVSPAINVFVIVIVIAMNLGTCGRFFQCSTNIWRRFFQRPHLVHNAHVIHRTQKYSMRWINELSLAEWSMHNDSFQLLITVTFVLFARNKFPRGMNFLCYFHTQIVIWQQCNSWK